MGKRFLLVLVVALVGAFLSSFGEQLGQLYVPLVLIGTCLGGAVALMPIGTPISRAGAFFVGFAFEALAVLLRAALLPSTGSGRAVGAFMALALSGVVFALTKGRLPYPAMLIGIALIEGAYALRMQFQPSLIVWEMPSYLAGPLFAAGVGFTVCVAMMAIFGDRIGVRDAEWPVVRTRDGDLVEADDGTLIQEGPVVTEPAPPPTVWNPPPSQPPRPEPTS